MSREKISMTAVYQIDVQGADGYRKFAQAFGDLDTINYIAKKVVKDIENLEGNVVLNLDEVDAVGGQPIREVVALTANARVVVTVLKGELTSERKAARTSAEPAEEGTANLSGVGLDEVQTIEHFAGEYDNAH